MAYKKLIKVSNVCQLLDKSKFLATQTINGVTFTNNGDGTITVNGTATQDTLFHIFTAPYTKNHIILLIGCPSGGSSNAYCINTSYGNDYGNGVIKKNDRDITTGSIYIRIYANITVSNLIFKPQLFDLTEMYGAGNEPTTVEQFRQDFPEEMYDYSPYCWLTSYKRVFMTGGGNYLTSYQRNLTCKTKNLLNINKAHNLGGVNRFDTFSISGNTATATVSNSNFNVVIINLFSGNLPAGSYCFSCTVSIENSPLGSRPNEFFVFRDGSMVTLKNGVHNGNSSVKFTFNSSGSGVFRLDFYRNVLKIPTENLSDTVYRVTFSNIQLELGDTATDYVPYGHL